MKRNRKPHPKVISIDMINAIWSSSWKAIAIMAHHDMKKASINRREPIILLMIRKFTISDYF